MKTAIPGDIWLYIASFVSDPDLKNLIGLNSVFLDAALSARYREVTITTLTINRLVRLMDPSNSPRVRTLYMHPHLKRDFMPAWDLLKAREQKKPRQGLKAVFGRSVKPAGLVCQELLDYPNTSEGAVRALGHALGQMTNVTNLHVDRVDYQPGIQAPLIPMNYNTYSKLESLTLRGNLINLGSLLPSFSKSAALQDITVQITDIGLVSADTSAIRRTVEAFGTFVNAYRSTLRQFTLLVYASFDFSTLFDYLTTFPSLVHLRLQMPFNTTFPTAESMIGFTDFFCRHSDNLRFLDLKMNSSGWLLNPQVQGSLANWMKLVHEKNLTLSNLDTLKIFPTSLPYGFEAFIEWIRLCPDALQSLTARDFYMTPGEAKILVDALLGIPAINLKSIRLNLQCLTPSLLDNLSNFRGLRELNLFVGSDPHMIGLTAIEGRPTLDMFKEELHRSGVVYKDWALYDLGIWQGGHAVSLDVMNQIAECIPQLSSFWDEGHKSGQQRAIVSDVPIYENSDP